MYSKVDPKLKAKIKTLKMEYTDQPQPELLIPLPNLNEDIDHVIRIVSPEFTSLCPLAPTQPDYATITLEYRPDKKVIELKSLKFYYVSFRNVCIFHESVASKILRDLVEVLEPKEMTVTGDFTVRGGIHTVVTAKYEKPRKQ